MMRLLVGLVVVAAPALGGINAGWSCDGPLPSAHGPASGDIVDGNFEVLLHSTCVVAASTVFAAARTRRAGPSGPPAGR